MRLSELTADLCESQRSRDRLSCRVTPRGTAIPVRVLGTGIVVWRQRVSRTPPALRDRLSEPCYRRDLHRSTNDLHFVWSTFRRTEDLAIVDPARPTGCVDGVGPSIWQIEARAL